MLRCDSDTIAIMKMNPAGALLALAASGKRNFYLVGIPTAGFRADILAAAGALSGSKTALWSSGVTASPRMRSAGWKLAPSS